MATILKNNIKPGGSTLKNLVITNSAGTQQPVKFVRQVNSQGATATVYDTFKEYAYNGVSINSFSYGDIPANGNAITPSALTYSQVRTEVGHSGDTYGTASLTSGATITYSAKDANGNAVTIGSNGSIGASNLGASSKSRTKIATVTVTVTLNKQSTSKSFDVYQAANAITSTTWNNPSISVFSYPKTSFSSDGGTSSAPTVTVSQSGTNTWTSGNTSAVSNSSFTKTFAISGTGFTVNSSTGVVTIAKNNDIDRSGVVTVSVTGSGSKSATKTYTFSQSGPYEVLNDSSSTLFTASDGDFWVLK